MWLFHFLMNGWLVAALILRLRLKPLSSLITPSVKERMLGPSLEVMNYLFKAIDIDDVIAETDAALTNHTRASTTVCRQRSLQNPCYESRQGAEGYRTNTSSRKSPSKTFTSQSAKACHRAKVSAQGQ